MQGKIHIQFKQRPQIFVKLCLRKLCNSKLSGLHPFDTMAMIHWVKIDKKHKSRLWAHELPILEVIFVTLTENASAVIKIKNKKTSNKTNVVVGAYLSGKQKRVGYIIPTMNCYPRKG